MAVSIRENSTNVRIQSPLDPWPVRDVPAERAPRWALVAWTLFVAGTAASGVFARIEPEAYGALVVFAWVFMLAAAWIDADLAAALHAMEHPLRDALMLDAVVACAWALPQLATPLYSGVAGALAWLVGMPLAALLHLEAARRPRLRRAAGASPGAKRAAT